jgi:MFS family permease
MVSAAYFYSPSSVYIYMAKDLDQNVSGLGALTTAFVIGIGGFQIPAGLLAEKVGSRKTIIYGTTLAAASTLLTGFPSQLYLLALLRFLTGVGMAFIFAPCITLVARYFEKDWEGFGVGLVAASFDLGGVMVIPGWAVLGKVDGWRFSFILAGVLGLLAVIATIFVVPREELRSDFRFSVSDLRKVLFNKWFLTFGLAALSVQVGWNTIGSFMVFYLENSFSLGPAIAGLAGSVFLFCALLSSPIAGRIFVRVGRPVAMLVAGGLFSAVGLATAALVSPYAPWISTAIVGMADGVGFTTAYILAREVNGTESKYETLAVSWVNGISLFGSFWTPVLFSYSAIGFGYPVAWLVSSLASVPLVFPILALRITRGPVGAGARP